MIILWFYVAILLHIDQMIHCCCWWYLGETVEYSISWVSVLQSCLPHPEICYWTITTWTHSLLSGEQEGEYPTWWNTGSSRLCLEPIFGALQEAPAVSSKAVGVAHGHLLSSGSNTRYVHLSCDATWLPGCSDLDFSSPCLSKIPCRVIFKMLKHSDFITFYNM